MLRRCELAVVELREGGDAVLGARVLVDEAAEEEEVAQRLHGRAVERDLAGQRLAPGRLEDLRVTLTLTLSLTLTLTLTLTLNPNPNPNPNLGSLRISVYTWLGLG